MALPSGAHVQIGDVAYMLDEAYEKDLGRRCYVHGGRTLFAQKLDITGSPGKNLREDRLLWYQTNFAGEGQRVLNNDDDASAQLFYRSEGLDFRTAGQAQLNRSIISEVPISGSPSAATTKQGNADFSDVSGTSTTSGTDRKLVATTDEVKSSNYTPGATSVQADFYLYREALSSYGTTIQGSALLQESGTLETSGTDGWLYTDRGIARTVGLTSPTNWTAGVQQRVEFTLYSNATGNSAQIAVVDRDGTTLRFIASKITNVTTSSAVYTLTFTPKSGRTYRFYVSSFGTDGDYVIIDNIVYGPEYTENLATIEIYNESGSASIDTRQIAVNASAAGSIVGSISFTAAAATNYSARVTRDSGKQAVWVDKVVLTPKSATAYTLDCLDFGVGQTVWLGGHGGATTNGQAWTYDTSTDTWTAKATFSDGTNTYQEVVRAMFHSDSLEFFVLCDDGTASEVYTSNSSGTDDQYAYYSGNNRDLVGGCIAQERVILMAEDSSGVEIYSIPETGSTPWNLNSAALTTGVQTLTITAQSKSPDTSLRQRMTSSPTGARFFVNSSNVTAKVYEVDASGSTLDYRQLADLGHGIQATSIAYEGGLTFVGALYYGSAGAAATSTDVEVLARPVLFVIDQNGVVQRIGFMRRDDPVASAPVFLVPYQTDLYILQAGYDQTGASIGYIWRYSLVTGGLFLEYEITPTTANAPRALAVLFGRAMAAFSDEIWVAGSVGTYRQSSISGGSSLVSSINDYGLPGTLKTLVKADVLADTLTSGTSIRVEYQIDQDGTWTLLGEMTSGSKGSFLPGEVTFYTIQFRTTLLTDDGTATPVLHAVISEARAAEEEEYFDLVLRCEDDDSYDHPMGDNLSGDDRAQNVISLWRSGKITVLEDGYASKELGDTTLYQVAVDDLRDERNALGEGRLVCTLRVVR
jgi:hypothetical protein